MTIKQLQAELAMPQLIEQSDLDMTYVNKWKLRAERYLKHGEPKPIKMPSRPLDTYKLYHYQKSGSSGVWFIVNKRNEIGFLYAYQSVKIGDIHQAAEALAYTFDKSLRGYIRDVFFDHLLPNSKFVVTDFMYTPDGHKWFEAEYAFAFSTGLNVYAIEIVSKREQTVRQIDRDEFTQLQSQYWGMDDEHQKYRFAIEHK